MMRLQFCHGIKALFSSIARKSRKVVLLLAVRLYRRALIRHGVAAAIEHASVVTALKECVTVVDIGANRGQFSLTARHVFPEALILSFEPLPGPAAVCRKVFADDDNTRIHEAAIGLLKGESVMHVSASDDSSSLLPITDLQTEVFPGTAEVATIDVFVAPLDEFVELCEISQPALLKLDVQGFELDALQGCQMFLPSFSWIYCECSFVELYGGQKLAVDVVQWLFLNGFGMKGIYNVRYDSYGETVQADFLFGRV